MRGSPAVQNHAAFKAILPLTDAERWSLHRWREGLTLEELAALTGAKRRALQRRERLGGSNAPAIVHITLGEAIRVMRIRAGQTQGDLAHRLGVSRATINACERGRIDAEKFFVLASALYN